MNIDTINHILEFLITIGLGYVFVIWGVTGLKKKKTAYKRFPMITPMVFEGNAAVFFSILYFIIGGLFLKIALQTFISFFR